VRQGTRQADIQRAFSLRHPGLDLFEASSGLVLVLPSLTLPTDELRRLSGIWQYEERLLFLLLLLRHPRLRLVYLSSAPVDDAIVEYYLDLLPDPVGARERLELVSLDDRAQRPLTAKLLERPEVIERVRRLGAAADDAWLVPFNVTALEERFAELVELPVYGPEAGLARLGSKSDARRIGRAACVPVPDGVEDLYTPEDLERAVAELRARLPSGDEAVVLKLNDSFSGQGNVVLDLRDPGRPLADAASFSAAGESWTSFLAKMAARGAVLEELLQVPGMRSSSVLVRIAPGGGVATVATHDQILGGPNGHVYLGCRFPADGRYRSGLQACGEVVGAVLAGCGVIGHLGIDFFVVPGPGGDRLVLGEINLRLGGTTHPFGTALLASSGAYDRRTGTIRAGGAAKGYVATDNFAAPSLVGRTPAEVIGRVRRLGLAFSPGGATGAVLHLLGAVPEHGKLGFVCIADSVQDAEALYAEVSAALAGPWRPASAGQTR
jgi:hypothetical protein